MGSPAGILEDGRQGWHPYPTCLVAGQQAAEETGGGSQLGSPARILRSDGCAQRGQPWPRVPCSLQFCQQPQCPLISPFFVCFQGPQGLKVSSSGHGLVLLS